MKSLADHAHRSLPSFAVPLFLRVTRVMHTTGTNKQQKHHFQKDNVDVDAVEKAGDILYWLKDGTYERFGVGELGMLEAGRIRL